MDTAFLEKYRGKRVCVAVSGGMDSVCLLYLLSENAERYNIVLSALTCEHGIRGEESLADVKFVQELCARLNVPLTVFSANVPQRAKQSGRGLEEEGRAFRYECFSHVLSENKADLVATAHHADDVAETVLFRLARGTSLTGIVGIRERGGIVRPLLNVSKDDVREYMNEHGYSYREDATNGDERYTRNRIRARVLPLLEEAVSGAAGHIAAFARRAGEDDEYLKELALQGVRREGDSYFVDASLARPLFFRACLFAAAALGCERDYSEPLLMEIERLKELQSGRKICLKQGVEAAKEGGEIVFYTPQEPFCGEFPFGEGSYKIGAYRVQIGQKRVQNAQFLRADLDAFPAGCVLRTRREGDVFAAFGGSRKTLKEFLTDRKVPARVSRALPLVARGNEVLLVFGVEIADCVKITDKTAKCGYFCVQPIN